MFDPMATMAILSNLDFGDFVIGILHDFLVVRRPFVIARKFRRDFVLARHASWLRHLATSGRVSLVSNLYALLQVLDGYLPLVPVLTTPQTALKDRAAAIDLLCFLLQEKECYPSVWSASIGFGRKRFE